MCFPFKNNPSPDIRDRLLRKLIVPVHTECCRGGVKPGIERLIRHLDREIQSFIDEYGFSMDNFPEWAESNYPDFDVETGGDQGEAGNYDDIYADYEEEEADALIANYYEDNWDGEIEAACIKGIIEEMGGQGVDSDQDCSADMIREYAGDEYDDSEDEDEEVDEE